MENNVFSRRQCENMNLTSTGEVLQEKELREFRQFYGKVLNTHHEVVQENTFFEERVSNIREGGLVDTMSSEPILNLDPKVLYSDMILQRRYNPTKQVTEIPYWGSCYDSPEQEIAMVPGDVEDFEKINEEASPLIISTIGNAFLDSVIVSHRDLYTLVSMMSYDTPLQRYYFR